MTNYTNCISIEKALYFDLFDDIDYKWLKLILSPSVDREEYDFEVEIEDIPVEKVIEGFFKTSPECRTTFTFDLKMSKIRPSYNANGYITEYITKTFTKTIDYDASSPIAMALCDLQYNEEDE
jgi:hypothetical protein